MRYTKKLEAMSRCTAKLGLYVATEDPDLDYEEHAGPFVLRCAETDYNVHCVGVDAYLIERQLAEIEAEQAA